MFDYKLIILLLILLYLLYTTIDLFKVLIFGGNKMVRGCGEGCRGNCKKSKDGQMIKDLKNYRTITSSRAAESSLRDLGFA